MEAGAALDDAGPVRDDAAAPGGDRALPMPGSHGRGTPVPDARLSHLTGAGVLDALGLAFFSLSGGLRVFLHHLWRLHLPSSDGALRSRVWVVTLASCHLGAGGADDLPGAGLHRHRSCRRPGLTFVTMPAVFSHLPFGRGLAVIFFLLLLVALSSSISMLEHLVGFTTGSGAGRAAMPPGADPAHHGLQHSGQSVISGPGRTTPCLAKPCSICWITSPPTW